MLGALQKEARAARRRAEPKTRPGRDVPAGPDHDDPRLEDVRVRLPALAAELTRLDAGQREAVLSGDAALVRAPVGSGKTTVLVLKLLYLHLVMGVPLERIAVLTFTTRAARELRERVGRLGGTERLAALWLLGTFHGVARALLARALPVERLGRRPDFTILDDDARELLWRELIVRNRLRLRGRRALRRRMEERTANAVSDDLPRLRELYEEEKRARNVLDFDDLIEGAITLLPDAGSEALPPEWILVDELQDCRPRELELVRRLRGPRTKLFAVGDPLQSIYGWRGSAPAAFDTLAGELDCGLHALGVSYRSTGNVLRAARSVLGLQPVAKGKLAGMREDGAPVVVRRHHDEIAEALAIADRLLQLHATDVPWRELAVLFRMRAQATPIVQVLTAQGIPVDEGPAPDASAEPRDAVRVLTLHAAKGLEFRHVFIAGVNQGVLPFVHGRADDAEERRLLFVGMTRARDGLELSHLASPALPRAVGRPSPYLDALPADAVTRIDLQKQAPAPKLDLFASIPAPTSPSPPPATDARWQAGQDVRHPRYGTGKVVQVDASTVEVDFGKLGKRSFPLRLCPLQGAA